MQIQVKTQCTSSYDRSIQARASRSAWWCSMSMSACALLCTCSAHAPCARSVLMGRQRAELMLEVGRWCAFGRERLWQCARSGVASQLPEPGGMHRCCVQIPRTSGLMVGSDAAGWLRQRGCQGCRGAGVVVAWGGGAVRSSGRCLRHVGWLGPVVPPALWRLHCSSTCATSSPGATLSVTNGSYRRRVVPSRGTARKWAILTSFGRAGGEGKSVRYDATWCATNSGKMGPALALYDGIRLESYTVIQGSS